jgi:hypothetical protein
MTDVVWDLAGGSTKDGTKVRCFSSTPRELQPTRVIFQVLLYKDAPRETWRIWKLLPVKVEGVSTLPRALSEVLGSGSPPSYNGGATEQSSTRIHHADSERDDFGTIVTEVTTITKRYRLEDT